MSTRLLLLSATMSLPFTVKMLSGLSRPVAVHALVLLPKAVWPTTTSAGAWVVVGAVFQMSTRLLSYSSTSSLPLALTTVWGPLMPSAVALEVDEVRLAWPSTKSALAPLLVGMPFEKPSTRLRP